MAASETTDNGPSVWDIVRVEFPHVDEPTVLRHRPALVIAAWPIDQRAAIVWLLMITSARHSAWQHDAPIEALEGTGLSRPCVVRVAKVAVLEARLATRVGALAIADRARVRDGLRALLSSVLE